MASHTRSYHSRSTMNISGLVSSRSMQRNDQKIVIEGKKETRRGPGKCAMRAKTCATQSKKASRSAPFHLRSLGEKPVCNNKSQRDGQNGMPALYEAYQYFLQLLCPMSIGVLSRERCRLASFSAATPSVGLTDSATGL